MKFIDSKGRLFGIINIFDLFVLLIIAYIAFFSIRWIHLAEDPSWTQVKTLHTRCTVGVEALDCQKEFVRPGDELLDTQGNVVARIEKIVKKEPVPTVIYYSKEGEKLFFRQNLYLLTVVIDLLSYERKGELYSLIDSHPIKIGYTMSLQTKKYSLQGVVLEFSMVNDK